MSNLEFYKLEVERLIVSLTRQMAKEKGPVANSINETLTDLMKVDMKLQTCIELSKNLELPLENGEVRVSGVPYAVKLPEK